MDYGQAYGRVLMFLENRTVLGHEEGDWVIRQYKDRIPYLLDLERYRQRIRDPFYRIPNLYGHYFKSMIQTQAEINKIMQPYGVRFYLRESGEFPVTHTIRITDDPRAPNGIFIAYMDRYNDISVQDTGLDKSNVPAGKFDILNNRSVRLTVRMSADPTNITNSFSANNINWEERFLRPNFDRFKFSLGQRRMPERFIPPNSSNRYLHWS